MNKVILIGNVGNDPETKEFEGGNKMVTLSLATTENWKDKNGEKKSKTEWHNLSVYGKLSDVVEKYVKKGDKLAVTGKISTSEVEKDGEKKYFKNIIVQEMEMLGKPNGNGNANEEQKEGAKQKAKASESGDSKEDDDLPF